MATVVTWNLNLNEVEIGKEVEFTAEGLDAHEGLGVFIELPNGSSFLWGVKADERGRVRDTIKLDSGLGQYVFCPKPACGYVNPRCRPLNVCPCGTSKTDCDVKITGPSHILRSTRVTYQVTGLRPSRAITATVANNQQVTFELHGSSDIYGNYDLEFYHAVAGVYSITVTDGYCASPPKLIEVANSQNEFPRLTPINTNQCASGVDMSMQFFKSTYGHSEDGYISVSVCNRGPEFRQISLTPSLVLPGATITSMPIPATLGLSGYRCEEYVILFKTGNSDTNYTANLFGSYECGGLIYTANGGSTNARVGTGSGVCSAMLQFFGTTSGSLNAAVNEEVELSVTVFNTGNQIIDSFSVLQFALPANVVWVSTFPATSAAINPGEAKTVKVKVKPTAAGTYTIQMPADKITYVCGTTSVPLGSVAYVTLTVA